MILKMISLVEIIMGIVQATSSAPDLTFAYHLTQPVVGGGILNTSTGLWPDTVFGVNTFSGPLINATASTASTIGSLLAVQGTNDTIVDYQGQYIGTTSDNVSFSISEVGWTDIQKGATSRHKWFIGGDGQYSTLATSYILCKAGPYTGSMTNEIDCYVVS